MDPKTAQPTPAAGSSKDQQGATVDEQEPTDAKESITWTTTKEPSGAETYRPTVKWPGRPKEEQLPAFPDISIRQKFRPRVSSEQIMSTVAYFAMFVSYEWYETDGRKLIREDVLGIMCMVFFGSEYKSSKPFYDKFDNPDGDPGIITMQATYAEFAAAWVPQVDIWYQELKKVDSATRARDEALKGL